MRWQSQSSRPFEQSLERIPKHPVGCMGHFSGNSAGRLFSGTRSRFCLNIGYSKMGSFLLASLQDKPQRSPSPGATSKQAHSHNQETCRNLHHYRDVLQTVCESQPWHLTIEPQSPTWTPAPQWSWGKGVPVEFENLYNPWCGSQELCFCSPLYQKRTEPKDQKPKNLPTTVKQPIET